MQTIAPTPGQSLALPHPLGGRPGSASAEQTPERSSWPFLTLTFLELRYLVEQRLLAPSPDSLIADLLEAQAPLSRRQARQAEEGLRAKGFLTAEQDRSEAAALFEHSLRILARPEGRLLIARRGPDEQPSLIPLFLRGDLAAPGFVDQDGLHAGAPMDRAQLTESMEDQLRGDQAAGLDEPFTIPALALRAVETIWQSTGREAWQAVTRGEAFWALHHRLDSGEQVDSLLDLLADTSVVEEEDGEIRLESRYVPWLERWLSGHVCELEYTPLASTTGEEEVPERLLFLGPPGRRVLCSEDVTDTPALEPGGDEEAIRLCSVSRGYLTWRLNRLLRFA